LIIGIQRLLMNDIENKKTNAADRARCAIAYDKLEDRLRVLNNKPLPTKGTEPKRRAKGPAPLPLPEAPSLQSIAEA
jgi:hypothetical protein